MLEISILKIQDPGCFWGRIVKGVGLKVQSPQEYENLHMTMNLFYHDVTLDVQKIKPASLAERQVCVVYSPTLKSWCRAVVESIFLGTASSHVMCFLVDHAEHILVRSDSVRAPLEKFLKLPFWVRKFQLAGISPMRLQVPICQDTAKLVPSTHWDSSATLYLHNLVQASSLVEAVLCEVLCKEDAIAVELYVTIRNVKLCVNDDMVGKKFACFTGSGSRNCPKDASPATLERDIFSISPRKALRNGGPEMSQTVGVGSGRATPVQPTKAPEPAALSPETGAGAPTVRENLTSGQEHSCEDNKKTYRFHSPQIVSPTQGNCSAGSGGSDGGVAKGASDSSDESLAEAVPSDGSEVDGSGNSLAAETQTSLADEFLNKFKLFRFMKFLNPTFRYGMTVPKNDSEQKTEMDGVKNVLEGDAEAQEISTAPRSEDTSAAPPPDQACVASVPVAEEAEEEEAAAFVEKLGVEEELDCARLLQLLNPDPLNPDVECSDSTSGADSLCQNIPCEPRKSGILFHSAIDIDSCISLACSPLTDNIRKDLVRKGYSRPRVAEWYTWPAVARGCDTLLISSCASEPITYIPPLLAHLHQASPCSTLTSCIGPIAVILCHGWEKAQCVFDFLEEFRTGQSLHPVIVLVGEKDEAQSVKIQRNCQVLVTTPFSLARLLGFHCFLFLRLCHLVLDEVDILFSKAPEQMAVALQHFQKLAASEDGASRCKQIVAVSRHWSRDLESLLREHMTDPSIIITVMEEAALYGGVHQMVLLCLERTKVSVLLGTLDFTPEAAQKTLIIANTVEEVERVFQAVNSTAGFCLMVHEDLTYQFDFIAEQWRKEIGPGTHVILVTTNKCLKVLGIQDATCVVHYGFPSSPRLFGSRLGCMSHNFQNLSDKDGEKPAHRPKSMLLLSEHDARHVTGVLRYLERSQAVLPPELLHFAQGVLQAREEQKTGKPLCGYLKSFGFCRDSRVCPDRHCVDPKQDAPLHPDSGTVVVLPLFIKNASCYYGRIVSRSGGAYESLAAEMGEYYATEKFNAREVEEGGIYGIQEEGVYHRVQVLVAPDRGERLFCSVRVRFLDEGREQEVKAHQLLALPERLHRLPPQALEIIVCRAKPIDGEMDWNPKVNRCISQKIKGVEHHGKIVLSLGNTVWVDPMVRITRLPGLRASINEYDVRSEILATGMGTSNPEHLELLQAVCQGTPVSPAAREPARSLLPTAPAEALEIGQRSPAEDLADRIKACADGLQSGREEPADPPEIECAVPAVTGPQGPLAASETGAGMGSGHTLLSSFPSELNGPRAVSEAPESKPRAPATFPENRVQGNGLTTESSHGCGAPPVGCPTEEERAQTTRFHPHIKWFERDDVVTLIIKLLNPSEQKCELYSDRVVYSACLNGRHYHADLELSGRIVAERSTWGLKCNEPVLRLIKAETGPWNALLRRKSPFVTFDFDHFEGDEPAMEDMASNYLPVGNRGDWFVGCTGDEGCYVRSDSESDSD